LNERLALFRSEDGSLANDQAVGFDDAGEHDFGERGRGSAEVRVVMVISFVA
jgi:hypothetical protein